MKSYGLLAIAVAIFSISMFQTLNDIRLGQSSVVTVTALNYWNASQARFELERTLAALDAHVGNSDDVSRNALIDRFEIFWSRLPLLIEGKQSKGIIELTDAEIIIPKIIEEMEAIESDIIEIEPGDSEKHAELRRALLSFEAPLQDILLRVHHAHDAGFFSLNAKLEQLYTKHAAYLIGALASGTILIVFLLKSIRKAQVARRTAYDARLELETVINAMPLSIDAVDHDCRLTLFNDYGGKAHGIDTTEAIGRLPTEVGLDPLMEQLNRQVFATGQATPAIELTVNQPDSAARTWLVSKVPVTGSTGKVRKVVTVGIDITERKRAEAQIQHMAQHDALTGLPNRSLFQERLSSAIDRAGVTRSQLALLCIDFDHFKHINDRLGHQAGDRFLVHAARRLEGCVGKAGTLARLGGDEFAIILEEGVGVQEVSRLAERLTAAFREPIDIGGQRWFSTISVGIGLSPRDGTEPEPLLRHADLALYEAKARGGNMLRFFLPEMKDRQQYLYWVQQDLRRAIVEDELTLHYQPKIRLIDHQVSGFEALLRWNHPQRGAVSPTEFIPAAENCHLIVELGQLVLRKTCAQVVQWQREGLDPPPVAINLSAAQFVRQDVAAMVLRTLDETGLPPELLELEVTESILLGRSDNVRDTLSALRALGIGITLDDFGTGYSSLSYLQRFPINKIKIDKTFVQSIAKGQSDLAIVRAIIAMAHSLEITVVAEGVESEAQCRTLANLACDEVQGFYIGHAEPPEHSSRWLHLNAAHTLVGLRPLAAVGHG